MKTNDVSDMKFASLRSKILAKYFSYKKFSEVIGQHVNTVSRKLNGVIDFTANDIVEWCERLDIPIEESGRYFFD